MTVELQLEVQRLTHELSMARDQLEDAKAKAWRYHKTIDLVVARLACYRRAVKNRMTSLSEKFGITYATLQARIEELESQNKALIEFERIRKEETR